MPTKITPAYVAAIDPGASGALCIRCVRTGAIDNLARFGTEATRDFASILEAYHPGHLGIFIERVWASPAMGKSSAFAFGVNFGLWQGMALAHNHTIFQVTPQEWQKAVCPGITTTGPARKRDLRDQAKLMFPRADVTLETADALLLSEYALQQVRKS